MSTSGLSPVKAEATAPMPPRTRIIPASRSPADVASASASASASATATATRAACAATKRRRRCRRGWCRPRRCWPAPARRALAPFRHRGEWVFRSCECQQVDCGAESRLKPAFVIGEVCVPGLHTRAHACGGGWVGGHGSRSRPRPGLTAFSKSFGERRRDRGNPATCQ